MTGWLIPIAAFILLVLLIRWGIAIQAKRDAGKTEQEKDDDWTGMQGW